MQKIKPDTCISVNAGTVHEIPPALAERVGGFEMDKPFEIGKYYRHSGGMDIAIICEATTTLRGECFIAECVGKHDELLSVGKSIEHTTGFWEIPKEEWMGNFST